MELNGKVALVTGASRGIGEYVALELGRAGCAVAVCARTEVVKDKRLPGTIHSVAQAIRDAGGKAEGIYMDMREPESIAAGVAKTVETFGRLDIVVNNAAILVPGTIETIQPRHIDLIWQVDLRGPILLMREAIPHMRKQGGGRIINVSSVAGVFPGPGPYKEARRGGAFYGMVKAGLERLSQGLAMELQDDKITVNVLSPQGRIKTPGNLFAQNDPENPNLDFEPAFAMAKGARWICEQGPEFTGNILFDEDLAREKGLL
ncbi:MAG: SDR family NAD(P)-dependent oxidoreductase [Dehalococcoidia bacterium]|jgi:NAD(P)-dependent dehydrogenase (short-subunit alcohol dehydrogenase family)|uniref:SDR family NAD(P)-dependent oxidoreductase n=1 Tax=Candidatus Amarobacter glycogenicus TaxID=3140699 RepID=UPI002A0B34CB|nr:SDR family NAD(P)-dependent oxidoreductase [Dehalococcoidia bacterium]MBK7126121.1 SDR family NAD(P)-dependent oxidoreductase [Dehalococcoidia bacterium]MBK7329163.1 SDR family NAD(P)-dependent oxidoreductase [Dehalococcoidia bacterium]MBK8560259.1 SDR family NAD(P)-dependent oxidoreductase [Dehalococcoidia bacterium]MBK9342005.1 SDR family NAD(P)-dependent oxidoreductase [Dehalococcoidia bacterium]